MNKSKIIILVLVSVVLSSCIATRKFKESDLKVYDTLRDNTETTTDSIRNFTWREIFTDTHLQALIQEGIDHNSDLLMAIENVYQSEQYLKSGKWKYAPSVSLSAQSSYTKPTAGSEKQSFLGGSIGWEPDIWGKITASLRADRAALLKDQANVQLVKTAVVAQVASLYYQLLALDRQKAVILESARLSEETLKTLTIMRDNGKANSAAVVQAEAQLYSTLASVPEIEKTIYNTENALSIVLGRKAGNIERGQSGFVVDDAFIKKGIPFYMVTNRPDVKVAEYTLVQLFHLTQSAKASLYPSFNFSLQLGASGASMYNMVSPATFVTNFLGSITAPIFNGRALRTQYKVTSSKHRQAVIDFDNTLRKAGQSVSEALFGYQKYEEKVVLRDKEVKSSLLAVDYTKSLLLNGKVTYLEVLSAQGTYLQSALNQVGDELQREIMFITLYNALGGGWE